MSKIFWGLTFLLISFSAWSQVLDDSTKQIYSNKTVEYIYENDVLRNIHRPFHPDSLLNSFHYTNPVLGRNAFFQDLGNVGTASRSLTFEKEKDAAQQVGRNVNRLYTPDLDQLKYYNTRSPYTYLGYQQGGGHTQFEVIHSQNVNPRLNFTMNIFKFNSEKQYGFLRNGEFLVNHWKYSITSNYKSANGKYHLLGGFYHFNHKQNEQGGVEGGDTLKLNSIEQKYDRVYAAALSGDIYNRERWNNFHLYHQFLLKSSIQAFHILDFQHEVNVFQDAAFNNPNNAEVYGIKPMEEIDTLLNVYKLNAISNKVGFKGIINGVNYQAYARFRMYNLTNKFFDGFTSPWSPELFVGGLLGYVFKDSTNTLHANLELSTPQKYFLDARLFFKGFDVSAYNVAKRPGLFYQSFDNRVINVNQPGKDLKSENIKHLSVKLPLKLNKLSINPEVSWSQIENHTYLNEAFKTVQNEDGIHLFALGGELTYKGRNIHLKHRYLFNNTSNRTVYPLPKHMHHTNVEFDFLYAKVLRIYTGLDLYYKSKYRALSYSPLLGQFYVDPESTGVPSVPTLDAYVKFPISKGRISLNYHYLNKGVGFMDVLNFGKNGYFTTPGYLGQNSNFTIKIDWPLFD